jgi:FdrA protein
MIDFRLRNEYIVRAAEDPTTAVILLDIVLGYGSHPDPAGAILPAIERARRVAADDGRPLTIVASVCGTESDPQGFDRQEATLRSADVVLAVSDARAARLAARIAAGPVGMEAPPPTPPPCAGEGSIFARGQVLWEAMPDGNPDR